MDASLRAASAEWNDRASFNRLSRSDLMRPAPGMRVGGPSCASPETFTPTMVHPPGRLTFILLRPCRSSAQKPTARKRRFAQPFQRDLGRPAALSKIFGLTCRANQFYQLARLVPARGAYRDRHERGMGCGGRSSVRRADGVAGQVYPVSEIRRARRTALKRTAKPCGPDTRGWCQAAGGEVDPTGSISH